MFLVEPYLEYFEQLDRTVSIKNAEVRILYKDKQLTVLTNRRVIF